MIFEHEHNAALRDGDLKLVGKNIVGRDGLRPNVKWELYDLATDPVEQHNLAGEKTEMVEKLSQKFLEEARRTLVLPAP